MTNAEPAISSARQITVSLLTVENARHIVVRAPYNMLAIWRAIPGGRWSKAIQAWVYPATTASANEVLAAAKGKLVQVQPEVQALAQAASEALRVKSGADLPAVPGTKLEPWKHQSLGYHFAKALPASLLAMDMGTGKSAVVVWLIQNLGWKRVLILCPRSVVGVWPNQFATHASAPIPVLGLDGTESVAEKTAYANAYLDRRRQAKGVAVIVLNYEAAWREPFAAWALNIPWDAVICDEIHKIKDPSGVTSRWVGNLGRRALRRIGLTGTPMPHSPLDLFAQFRFLDPGIFGTNVANFRQHYAVMGGFGGKQVVRYQNQQDLERRMGSITFRVTKEVLGLPKSPPPTERSVRLSPKAMRTYRELEQYMTAQIEEGQITAANALVKLLRLAQITSGHIVDDDGNKSIIDSTKKEALEDYLEELNEREPVVVFGRFRHDLDVVEAVAKKLGRRYAELSGRRRDALTPKSTMSPDCDIAGVQIQSGGVGIDLTRAHYAAYYSLSWSLGEHEQSLARLDRPGQRFPVLYTYFITKDTVDETVLKALKARKNVVEAILERLK